MNKKSIKAISKHIPYPVKIEPPVAIENQGVAIVVRGLGISTSELSFILNVIVAQELCSDQVVEAFGSGVPFAMPHQVPDPEALTVTCKWKTIATTGWVDNSVSNRSAGRSPVEDGSWSSQPDKEIWKGSFSLAYQLNPEEVEELCIEISWRQLGMEPRRFVVKGEDLRFARRDVKGYLS